MIRIPLLLLDCADPIERQEEEKAADPRRQWRSALFGAWWEHHGDDNVAVRALAPGVRELFKGRDSQQANDTLIGIMLRDLRNTAQDGFRLQQVARNIGQRSPRNPTEWRLCWTGAGNAPVRTEARGPTQIQGHLPLGHPDDPGAGPEDYR